jgi:hypothetical protein
MTWQGAWALADVDTPVEVGRLLAYVASGGTSGIVNPKDCTVHELDTPGSSIRVRAGAGVVQSAYAAAGQQSYCARNPDDDIASITATGSGSGRSDLVCARVLDKQYPGVGSSGPETFIVEDVDPGTTTVGDAVAQGKTGLAAACALARVDLPARTSTVTQGMITDLREIVNPRFYQWTWTVSRPNDAADDYLTSVKPNTQVWPSFASVSVPVPLWAIRAHCQSIITCGSEQGKNQANAAGGRLELNFAGKAGADVFFHIGIPTSIIQTATLVCGCNTDIAPSQRGTNQTIEIKGWKSVSNAAELRSTWGTTVSHYVTFYEAPQSDLYD